MYLLVFWQADREVKVGLFENLEEGREFLKQIPSYKFEEENGFEYESFNPSAIPDYMELNWNKNIIPLTKYMFLDEKVDVEWYRLDNLSQKGNGLIESSTRVDAYSVNNEEVYDYISKREENYKKAKEYLESKSYKVERSFFGSEDGEAILYKKPDEEDWRFLVHMDPIFVDIEDLISYIEENLY